MCNCIIDIEKKLTQEMCELNPGCKIVETVSFENKTFLFGKHVTMFLGNPVIGKYRIGSKIKKFTLQIKPEYCPFCGEKIEENK
jgi:hypothetical protein